MAEDVALQFSTGSVRGATRSDPWQGLRWLHSILVEYRQAIAAEQLYEDLRYGRIRRGGSASTDISRSVLAQFYSDAEEAKLAAPAPGACGGRDDHAQNERRRSDA